MQKKNKKKRRDRNREYTFVTLFFLLIFVSLAGWIIHFNLGMSEEYVSDPHNKRMQTAAERVVRGRILSSDGQVLAQTNVAADGTEERYYPYENVFAHVIGYSTLQKSGLEAEQDFSLMTSHEFFLRQLKNEILGRKSQGDSVVSSLNATLQTTAYNALGDRRGAVIVMEPSTGRILAMVSKPDFNPNTIQTDFDALVKDEDNSSSLMNRALSGAYPPGSTFKILTALAYYRQKGTMNDFSYYCNGSITLDEHTINCYGSEQHGQEDLFEAFAHSCNSAFANLGVTLGGNNLKKVAKDLMFNSPLPFNNASKSIFAANSESTVQTLMQTGIGQGDTLVSPAHMCLIVSAIANKGIVMKPTLVDEIQNADGTTIEKVRSESYKRVMTEQEAAILGRMMEGVVTNGTASNLSGLSYTVAGKTGSAEFDSYGSSHSWFVGYSNVASPDLALAVIVENGGTGREAAVPIAQQIFDAYYGIQN